MQKSELYSAQAHLKFCYLFLWGDPLTGFAQQICLYRETENRQNRTKFYYFLEKIREQNLTISKADKEKRAQFKLKMTLNTLFS